MIKRIDIGGIERQLSVSNMADGSMYGMVGARHLDGNIRPAQGLEQNSEVSLADGDKLLYVHRYGDYEHYIVWKANMDLCFITAGKEELIEQEVRYITSVVSIGNMLIVVDNDTYIKVWLWQDGRYTIVSESGLPYIGIRKSTTKMNSDGSQEQYVAESDVIDIVPDSKLGYYSDIIGSALPTYIKNKNFRMQLTEQYGSLISNLREKASAENIFVDSYFVRYGLRMYDGSYLHVSPPIYIKGSSYELRCNSAEFSTIVDGTGNLWKIFQGCSAKADGYKLYANFVDMDSSLYVDGIVTAIDFFVSEPIREVYDGRQVDAVLSATLIGGNPNTTAYYEIKFGSMTERKIEDIESYFNYYRVWSVPVDGIPENVVEIDAKNKLNSIVQMPLLDNQASVHKYVAGTAYIYNGRLHIGNIREKLFDGYSPRFYTYMKDMKTERFGNAVMYVYLRDNGGEYIVKSQSSILSGVLSPYISYPDSRAYKIVVLSKEKDLGSEEYSYSKRTFLLKEHPFANESYYFDGYNTEDMDVDSATYLITKDEYNTYIADTTVKSTINRQDVLKVSELNNPLVWPNDKTYTVGSGNIVSMAVATKAMSQGQFGQYPLYVFTSEGIYAMLSGGGDVLYSNVAPVNRHIVENAKTVCAIDDAVVFGTRQGLFVMSGGDAVCISGPLDDHGIVRNNRGIETVVAIRTGETLTEMTTMRSLIAESMVSYDYINEEVLLYKPGNLLCYAYSLRSKMWQSYKRSVDYAVNSYPELLLIAGKKVLRTSDEDSLKVEPVFLLVTNGMQLSDAMSSKRIERIHLLSHFAGNGEDSKLLLAVAGSNDGEEYALTYEQEYKVRELHNVTLPHSASAYRYMSLIVYGKNLDKRSYLNGIVVEYDDKRKER
ncbi:MAG: hypothetical protein IKY13_10020 [Bacteroidaceae bacterium]|nr:hypothetical protein [Bacteroidaceae bacterium]